MNKWLLFFLIGSFQSIYSQISFQDQASELGVNLTYGKSTLGGGVSFVDFDGDGWDDITLSSEEDKEIYFFKNNQGTFSRVNLGITDTFETKQILWVDYDNDGDKDLFVTSITGLNKFYENNGNLVFTDISASSGLFTTNLYSYGAAFGDIDNDGDLDIFITNRDVTTKNQRNYLYLNDNNNFIDITESAGLFLGNELSFCASFFDYDNDGYQDIYVSSDKYTKINRLYKNKGDLTFEDVSESSGAGMAIDAMSTTIEDYNNDGWQDIYVTNTSGGNYHLRNNGDGTFTNVAEALGTAFYSIAWGANYLDAENDGDLDLYVSGMLTGSDERLPSAFYENQNGIFNIPENAGFENDNKISFANAIGDIDNDGLADIIVMNDTDLPFLWKNKSVGTNNWLKAKLQGTQSNRDGIGSTIEISSNGKEQYRYTLCGEGYLGQNSSYEFFGLQDAVNIDYIKVTWLSGTVDIINNVQPNQSITIVEGEGIKLQETSDSVDVVVYPNPSENGIFNINVEQLEVVTKLKVFNVTGQNVLNKELPDLNEEINIGSLSKGIYYLKVIAGDQVEHISLINN
jgi:ASPIC/UnbV protein/VCBS repeat protein/type IX secretion system substrate protein